jgi:hypothetical protein
VPDRDHAGRRPPAPLTLPANVWTDGGAEGLNATDDITSPFTGTAGYSETDGYDLKVEVVHNTPTLFTA